MPDTAIIIVTHDRPGGLRQVLADLSACLLPPEVKRIYVIENGNPANGSAEICAAANFPVPLEYRVQDDPSKSKALNYALASSPHPFAIFFDDDIRIDPQAVSAFVSAAQRYGTRHHFGGRLIASVEESPPAWLEAYLPLSAMGFHPGDQETVYTKPLLLGANWAAFKDEILAVGGYPEYLGPRRHYRVTGEETVLQQRLLAAGSTGIYVPAAIIHHTVHKESNTAAFALRRANAYTTARTMAEYVEAGKAPPRLPPRWMVRKLGEAALRYAISVLSLKDAPDRFPHLMDIHISLGHFRALKLLSRYSLVSEHAPVRWRLR